MNKEINSPGLFLFSGLVRNCPWSFSNGVMKLNVRPLLIIQDELQLIHIYI